MRSLKLPLSMNEIQSLRAGDEILLSGEILTARDAAHLRLVNLLDTGEDLPVDLRKKTIYYVGPAPAKPGEVIGAAGPTSSYRMDELAIRLMPLGVHGMIGKGKRSDEFGKSLMSNQAVYFATYGGAGALLADCIKSSEVIAFADLGTEAIRCMTIQDFPVIVAMDCLGGDVYKRGEKNEGNEKHQ